ncbi:MAG: DUF1016 N-terminal domain-containing protein [Rhodocyclaceae bacterium]|nr:DUF1016 N-terminal domain-containing protein [Rhodocyclaceae bacterium]
MVNTTPYDETVRPELVEGHFEHKPLDLSLSRVCTSPITAPSSVRPLEPVTHGDLMARVVTILDQARTNVIRAVNSNMVIAYWLIGREIVQALQGGEDRADYGSRLLEELSESLKRRYGRGFSVTNLRYFRTFYTVYCDRLPEIRQIRSDELNKANNPPTQTEVLEDISLAATTTDKTRGFSPRLGWSHYQVLMGVENRNERLFYEIETEREGWEVKHLARQTHTFLFARLLKSRDKAGVMALSREGHRLQAPADAIKNPYVLDFLGLPESERLHETVRQEKPVHCKIFCAQRKQEIVCFQIHALSAYRAGN